MPYPMVTIFGSCAIIKDSSFVVSILGLVIRMVPELTLGLEMGFPRIKDWGSAYSGLCVVSEFQLV